MKCMDFSSSVGPCTRYFYFMSASSVKSGLIFSLLLRHDYEEKVSVNLGLSRVVASCRLAETT